MVLSHISTPTPTPKPGLKKGVNKDLFTTLNQSSEQAEWLHRLLFGLTYFTNTKKGTLNEANKIINLPHNPHHRDFHDEYKNYISNLLNTSDLSHQ